jgi:hypothetical protein
MNRRVLVPVEADEAYLALLFCLGKGFENSIGRVNQLGVVVVDNLVNLPDIEMVGLEPHKRVLQHAHRDILFAAMRAESKEGRMNSEMMKGFGALDESTHAVIREAVAIGKELGVSAAQVALAWLRHRAVPVIPIVGARKLAQWEDNLASLRMTFTAEQLQRLDKVSAVPLGFPHDFLALESVRAITTGGMSGRIKA